MKRSVSPFIVVGLFVIGLAMWAAVGLPYGDFDWVAFSQGYGGAENLALDQPVVASSYLAEHPAFYAADGDLDTAWESYSYNREWLYVHFTEPQPVNTVVVNWGPAFAYRYRISILTGSYDYQYWQPVHDETSGDGGVDVVSFAETYAYAVAISMFDHVPGYSNFSIREFEVYYLGTGPQQENNFAAGVPAYATSYLSGYEPSFVTDVDTTTSWRPDPLVDPYQASVYVDLGETYDVSQVDLYWGDLYPYQYRVYVWAFVWSGYYGYWAWWPVYEAESSGGHNTAAFSGPISTRYVRVTAYKEAGQTVDLQEFEVYGAQPPAGESSSSAGNYLTPQMVEESAKEALRDFVPPGWKDSPALYRQPGKEGVPAPEPVPLKAVPSLKQ